MTNETLRVLVVEDNADDVDIIRRLLSHDGLAKYQVQSVGTTEHCVRWLQAEGADLVLLDWRLPGEDGLSFLRRLGGQVDLPPVILMTGQGDERLAAEAIRCGAFDYFPKGLMTEDSLGEVVQRALERFRQLEELAHLDEQIMVALAAAAEGKDAAMAGHLQRLAHCAAILGRELGLTDQQLQVLHCGTLLHDIGKLAVRTSILTKPGSLTEDEWEEMRQHPIVGERICGCLRRAQQVAPIIRHHHERWDGGGYPDGLIGEEIPYLARIVSVVDAFDVMSSGRSYRRALSQKDAMRRLADEAGHQFDPEITQVVLDLIDRGAVDIWSAARRHRTA